MTQYIASFELTVINLSMVCLISHQQAEIPISLLRWERKRQTSLRLRRSGAVSVQELLAIGGNSLIIKRFFLIYINSKMWMNDTSTRLFVNIYYRLFWTPVSLALNLFVRFPTKTICTQSSIESRALSSDAADLRFLWRRFDFCLLNFSYAWEISMKRTWAARFSAGVPLILSGWYSLDSLRNVLVISDWDAVGSKPRTCVRSHKRLIMWSWQF